MNRPSHRNLGGLLPLVLLGCAPKAAPPAPTPEVRRVTLVAGTPVKLVLLDELTSGGTEKGTTVRLALAEPVDGVAAMSPATATVSWSRTEGTLGAFSNRPARLNLTLESLTGPVGEAIPLSADRSEAKDVELNRDNTGRPGETDPGEENEVAQRAVQELIQQGQSGGLDAKQVGDLARRLGMGETAKLADAGQLDKVQNLMKTVRAGGTVASLASGGTVAAALEMVNLAGDVGHRLGRSLGGRNIRAYPGTIIPAYIARSTTLTPTTSAPVR